METSCGSFDKEQQSFHDDLMYPSFVFHEDSLLSVHCSPWRNPRVCEFGASAVTLCLSFLGFMMGRQRCRVIEPKSIS